MYVFLLFQNSASDFMKKFSESVQKKQADDAVEVDSDELSAKKMKVTDELRYYLPDFISCMLLLFGYLYTGTDEKSHHCCFPFYCK